MKKLIKLVFLLMIVGIIAGAVASYMSKKRFENMSDDEIRAFLASKLEGKLSEEQVESIQKSVIAGVRASSASADDHYVEDVQDAVEELTEVADDLADDAQDKASDAGEQVIEAVVEVTETD
ncbi:MAG: hypothetical protein ACR2N2_06005 [Acidimicrobiia bacterium]